MALYINPSFPGASFSYQTPPVGVRAELITRPSTTGATTWAVPAGVTYIKATLLGGGGDATTAGGTTNIVNFATATGGGTASNGTFSVTTTRFPQFIGANYSFTPSFTPYGAGTFVGGCGVVYLQNLIPGTTLRINVGAAGGGGGSGFVLLEY